MLRFNVASPSILMKAGLVILLASLFLVRPPANGSAVLTKADNRGEISLSPGEELKIVLRGNPSTGYLWELDRLDRTVLILRGEASFVPDSSLTGAGGRFIFRLIAGAAGSTKIRLVYRRPWETGIQPLYDFQVTVTVLE